MGNRYQWIMSNRLIPEVGLFEDTAEVHRILDSSLSVRRTSLVVGVFVAWVLAIVFASRTLAGLFGVAPWVGQVAIQPIGMLVGGYFLYNHGLRKPFQRALRQTLQAKGVPSCLDCGYDLRGQTEARCPECGSSFSAELLGNEADSCGGDGAGRG